MTDLTTEPKVAFSVREAAEAISIGSSTVWRLIHEGQLKTLKLGGRTLIRREELIRLLDSLEPTDGSSVAQADR
jgi:excisionase family DNA binding protein